MEAINIWYKLNLHWRKVGLLLLLLMIGSSARSQIDKRFNLMNYDNRQLHYGFQLGLNNTNFKLTHSDEFVQQDSVTSVRSVGTNGFSLGFILNLRLGEYFDARLLPTVAFYERTVRYNFNLSASPTDAIFESSIIELPMLLKYKSFRRANSRLYMVGGIKPAIEVGAKKKQKKSNQLRTKQFDLTLEYGFGADIYYPLFKFAPELRFSLGLRNLFLPDNNIWSDQIERLSTYTISFYFMFE